MLVDHSWRGDNSTVSYVVAWPY